MKIMKPYFILCVFLASLFVLSCQKNTLTTDDTIIPTVENEYYVRYISNGLSGYYTATYMNEKNIRISVKNQKAETFERIIGPVHSGFKASFSIQKDFPMDLPASVRIEVRKNSEPFLIKREGTTGVSYTIE